MCRSIGASALASPAALRRTSKRGALLPPYTTGSIRIRSNLDIKLGRASGGGNGELQIEGTRRGVGTHQEAGATSASCSSARLVGASIVGP
jgi:hypothetical protein